MESKTNIEVLQEQAKQQKGVKTPNEPKRDNNKVNLNMLYAIIGILVIVSGIGWYLYFDLKNTNKETVEQLVNVNTEKEEVASELKELIVQYEDLKSDNEEVNIKLSAEQERIEALLEEIKKVKSNNNWQIKKYKKELSTLRKIMKSYIYQIDSLNTLNINLRKENKTVAAENVRIASQNQKLEELTTDLTSTVEKASILKAIGIETVALKRRERKTRKARKVKKIRTCCTLVENPVAKSGLRFIYLRIITPEGVVLSGDENVLITDQDTIPYSDKREIQYDNKDIDICIFWDNDRKLTKGDYKVELISDGSVIGVSEFLLK